MDSIEEQECRALLQTIGRECVQVIGRRDAIVNVDVATLQSHCPCWYLLFERDPERALQNFNRFLRAHFHVKQGHVRLQSAGSYHVDGDSIKAGMVGKFVEITGFAFKAGSLQYHPITIVHRCSKCGTYFPFTIESSAISSRAPTKCITIGCQSKSFSIVRDSLDNAYRKELAIKIRDENATGSSTLKKAIEVILYDELTHLPLLGQQVSVCGIIKSIPCKGNVYLANEHYLCLEANNILIASNAPGRMGSILALSDFQQVLAREDKNMLLYLSKIFCRRIFGRTHVKKGIILSILGGSEQASTKRSEGTSVRSNCHALLIGDPGMGKSQLLLAASEIAPKGIYTCGVTSSSVGLTASATSENGEVAIEAGAVVLADMGVCCLDELDKIQFDHRSLLEAMEQQSVHIAKAGTVAALPARTSILAAANPINGHFDATKRLIENIKLPPPLLSRFDLIFVLRDEPNARFDAQMSRQIFQPSAHNDDTEGEHEFLRQYIAFARRLRPRMTEEAARKLFDHYMQVKTQPRWGSIPITVRYLESLIRLSEAHAKAYLRTFVTEQDVDDVIGLVQEARSGLTEGSNSAATAAKGKKGKSMYIRTFVQRVLEVCSQANETLISEEQLRRIFDNMHVPDTVVSFLELLDALNQQGMLLLKGGGAGSSRTFKVMRT